MAREKPGIMKIKVIKKLELSELLERIGVLLSVPKCSNKNYQVPPIPKEMQERIFKEQNGCCWLCLTQTTVPKTHHIKPDGASTHDNLVMLCSECHYWIHKMLAKHFGYRRVIRFSGFESLW